MTARPGGGSGYPGAVASRVGFLLARAHLIAREKADRALDEVGITMKAFAALATLKSDGATSQQRLSRRIRMDPATTAEVIDLLERDGHIVRRRNPLDRREYRLQMTRRGRALLARAERAVLAAEQETLQRLDALEMKSLMELLSRIAGADVTENLATEEEVRAVLGG
jgi:DNA-binding MarR family transcriptional regulator